MASIIWEIKQALASGCAPEKMKESTTEAYKFFDRSENPIAIFKPCGMGIKFGAKEVAAYWLDHEGFSGVLPTVFATFSHPILNGEKKGSCQLYLEESTPLVFVSRKNYENFDPENVRRIAILDIRTINTDRHTSNILYKDHRLIPIDHGAILPNALYGTHFVWTHWEQSRTPFSKEEKEYIQSLDPAYDSQLLIEHLKLPKEAAYLCWMATLLLKESIKRKLNAHQIGSLLMRQGKRVNEKYIWEAAPFERVLHKIKEKKLEKWSEGSWIIKEEIGRFVDEEAYKYTNQSAYC
jgi:hypothetical protein